MDSQPALPTTDRLQQVLVQRIVLLVFGCVAAAIVLGVLPLLMHYLEPVSIEWATRTRPAVVSDTPPISAFVSPVIKLIVFGLIAYGVYDIIRLVLVYRQRRREDEQLFP
jgi:hypothetical protein